MSRTAALRLEFFIIGLGLFALVLIFQPFSLTLFAIGSGLVVLAGLVNNLLPLARTGVPLRSVITIGLIVAMIFAIVILVSIAAAHFYGVFFLNPPDPNTRGGRHHAGDAKPFWMQPFVWWTAAVAVVLAGIVRWMSGKK